MRSGTTVKTCVKCKESVRVEYFYKCKKSSDGLHSYCKECVLRKANQKSYQKAYREKKKLEKAAQFLKLNSPM